MCLEMMSDDGNDYQALKCGHSFHADCVEVLKFFGLKTEELCPLCRPVIPEGPEQLCEVATRRLVVLETRVARGRASWAKLTATEAAEMDQVLGLYEDSASAGNLMSQTNLGILMHLGHGCRQCSPAEAAARWVGAAEGGDPRAQYNLSVLHQEGKGVERSDGLAAAWARKAAEQGHAEAMNALGTMHRRGDGVAQDDAEGAAWVLKAAEQGFPKAQLHMAQLCAGGTGVEADESAAAVWLKKAADGGDVDACVAYGCLLEEGAVVLQSDEGAVAYFSRAADKKHPGGQVKLGLMLVAGKGLSAAPDAGDGKSFIGDSPEAEALRLTHALACFLLASAQGDASGKALAADLAPRVLPAGRPLPAAPRGGDPKAMVEALDAARTDDWALEATIGSKKKDYGPNQKKKTSMGKK
jgi:TPR repeat protein